jgi:hypothetical protein
VVALHFGFVAHFTKVFLSNNVEARAGKVFGLQGRGQFAVLGAERAFRVVRNRVFLGGSICLSFWRDNLLFNCKMDFKHFAVSFPSAEKIIGSGFLQLADNVQEVSRHIKTLDQKYEELKAEIEALKAIKPQTSKETVIREVVVK